MARKPSPSFGQRFCHDLLRRAEIGYAAARFGSGTARPISFAASIQQTIAS